MSDIRLHIAIDKGGFSADVGQLTNILSQGMSQGLRPFIDSLDRTFGTLTTKLDTFSTQWSSGMSKMTEGMLLGFTGVITKLNEMNEKMLAFGGNAKNAAGAVGAISAATRKSFGAAEMADILSNFSKTGRTTTNLGPDGLLGRSVSYASPDGGKATVSYNSEDAANRIRLNQAQIYSTVDEARGESIRQRAEMWASRYGEKPETPSAPVLDDPAKRERAFQYANQYDDVSRQGRGAGEMSVVSEAINQRSLDRSIAEAKAKTEAAYKQFEADAHKYVERAFAHAANFAEMENHVGKVTELARKMWHALAGDGSGASQAMNIAFLPIRLIGGTLDKIGEKFNSLGNTAIRISAIFYSMKRIFDGLDTALLGPIEKIITATEESRKFQVAISPIVGGDANARAIDNGLTANINNTPFSLSESRKLMEQLTKIEPIAAQLTGSTPSQASSILGNYQSTIGGIQAINPNASFDSIAHGIEQALLGQGRSLRTVVQIDPDQLARLGGLSSQKDFKGHPEELMQALQQYLQIFGNPEALSARQNLPEVQIQHIRDQFEVAGQKIGDSGLFDAVIEKLKGMADSLADYVGSGEFQARAMAISASLKGILDNVTAGLMQFVRSLSGAQNLKDSPDGIVEGMQRIVSEVQTWSTILPSAGYQLGAAFRIIGSAILDFVDGMWKLTDSIAGKEGMSSESRTSTTNLRLHELGFGKDDYEQYSEDNPSFSDLGTGPATVTGIRAKGPNQERVKRILDMASGLSDETLSNSQLFSIYARANDPSLSPIASTGISSPTSAAQAPATTSDLNIGYMKRLLLSTANIEDLSGGFKGSKGEGLQDKAMSQLSSIMKSGALDPEVIRTMQKISYSSEWGDDPQAVQADAILSQLPKIRQAVSEYGFAMAKDWKGGAVGQASAFADAISGNTDLGKMLGGSVGLSQLNPMDQVEQLDAATKAQLNALKITSVDRLSPKSDSAISLLSGQRSIASQQVDIYGSALSNAQGVKDAAQSDLQAHPDDQNARAAFQAASEEVERYSALLATARQGTTEFFSDIVKFGDGVQKAMESSLSKGIADMISGTGKAKDVLKGFATEIIHAFSDMTSHQLIGALFGQGNGAGVGNGLGGLFGAASNGLMGLLSGGGASSFAGVAADPLVSSFQGLGLQGFANGGVANSPMISVFGEGRTAEAYIPMRGGHVPLGTDASGGVHAMLPGGGRIPAAFFADGGMMGRFNNSMSLGPHGGGGGDTVIHVHQHLDGKEIAVSTYRHTKDAHRADTLKLLSPGGHGRRALAKS